MNIPANVSYILDTLTARGYSAYLVGGCVRDMLMGKVPHDYDITTSATPNETAEVFSDHQLILAGKKHGTVAVYIGGELVEITTYRIDGAYADNRHPMQVSFTDRIEDDLARRDFTMNAIAMSKEGELIDPHGGETDIKSRVIRCVGEPKVRFCEDALRILRAVRFASVTGYEIEGATSDAVFECSDLLKNISAERIQTELFKTLCGANASGVMHKYKSVFEVFMPCSERIADIDKLPCDIPLRLAFMLKNAHVPIDDLRFLRVSNAVRDEVLCILENYKKMPNDTKHIRLLVGKHGADIMKKAYLLSELCYGTDAGGCVRYIDEIIKKALPCKIGDLAVTGDELKAIGLHGREIGKCLNELLMLVVSDEIENEREKLLECVKSL